MCGLVTILKIDPTRSDPMKLRNLALSMARQLRHRGPDWSGIYTDDQAILAHERLSIVDIESGAQPLKDTRTGCVLAVNGEIYNHKLLRRGLLRDHEFQTRSDCEVILYLYDELEPRDFLNRMNGIFAFVLHDPRRRTFLIARDPIGVNPLYLGWDETDTMFVASELKALIGHCVRICEFPPGHYFLGHEANRGFQRYYQPRWSEPGFCPSDAYDPEALRKGLEDAVHRQLMSDVPYGVLISGGVDSSLVASIAARFRDRRIEDDDRTPAWWPRIHSFAIGLRGAPDLGPARQVADYIGAIHHEIHFTLQEGLDALSDVIYQLETFDVTTVRAATPMYLMMRKIRAMGIKMILSGEGADEVFGGYLYFHKAPDGRALHEETVRKLQKLHLYDCLRANKASAAWGIEARVPFLDREFLDIAMSIDPELKLPRSARRPMPIEKYVLRRAFEGYIPDQILWRQKEQFSDGVGYDWINGLKRQADEQISDSMLRSAGDRFPSKTPETKEAYLYRTLFDQHFPGEQAAACVAFERSVACSTDIALRWDAAFAKLTDPSGRAVADVHNAGYR